MSTLRRNASLLAKRVENQTPTNVNPTGTLPRTRVFNGENTINRMPQIESPTVSKLKTESKKQDDSLNLSLNDCSCPICLEILVEPVQMPCHHELCLPCFKSMIDQTNLLCPICRLRISTWSRNASNSNTLINQARWEQIQRKFPNEIKVRMEGKTAQVISDSIEKYKKSGVMDDTYKTAVAFSSSQTSVSSSKKTVHCAEPGEIRSEYLEYLKREEEKKRIEKENEEKLSLELIQKLVQEEESLPFDAYLTLLNRETPVLSAANNSRQNTNRSAQIAPVIRTAPVIASANTAGTSANVLRHPSFVDLLPSASSSSTTAAIEINSSSSSTTLSQTSQTPVVVEDGTLRRRAGATGLNRNVSITAASLRSRPSVRQSVARKNEIQSHLRALAPSTSNEARLRDASAESQVSTTGDTLTRRGGGAARRRKLDNTTVDHLNDTNESNTSSNASASVISFDEGNETMSTRSLRPRAAKQAKK